MKPLIIKLWHGPEIIASWGMNPEGRVSLNILQELKFDRITIEPNDPDSKVQMTHYGAKYTPDVVTVEEG
jgi:hypothetical protein